jgi:hypothetical protein
VRTDGSWVDGHGLQTSYLNEHCMKRNKSRLFLPAMCCMCLYTVKA